MLHSVLKAGYTIHLGAEVFLVCVLLPIWVCERSARGSGNSSVVIRGLTLIGLHVNYIKRK